MICEHPKNSKVDDTEHQSVQITVVNIAKRTPLAADVLEETGKLPWKVTKKSAERFLETWRDEGKMRFSQNSPEGVDEKSREGAIDEVPGTAKKIVKKASVQSTTVGQGVVVNATTRIMERISTQRSKVGIKADEVVGLTFEITIPNEV